MTRKVFAVPVGEGKPGETAPYRNVGAKDGLWESPGKIKDVYTIYDLFQWAIKQHGPNQVMGWRTVLDVHEETTEVTKKVDGKPTKVQKQWQFFELSPYKYITYNQLANVVSDYAAGLLHIGMKPSGEDRLHLYGQTSAQWLQSALAANSQGIPCVTAYDTLGEEGLTHSMLQTSTAAIFVDNNILDTLINPIKKADKIRYIIHRDPIQNRDSDETVLKIKEVRPDIELYSYNEVIALGRANPAPAHPPKAEDVALIMYTSGSTGPPKGVVLLNKTVVAGVAGVTGNIHTKIITKKDRILAFLPLAHILEFTVEMACLYWGACLGYGTVKTISDVSVKNCKGDIREFQPTIMTGVPAVWESVKKGMLAKIKENPAIVQKVFWGAYHAKLGLSKMGLPAPFVDSVIFKKIKDATGGHLRYVLSGGAAISQETQQFISNLVCPVIIGYGLTETNANACLMTPASLQIGVTGEPTHAVEIKLVDVEEAGYFAKNKQGEIYIRGPCVSPYYYDNEEETKKAYTEDGYFQTGDIGEWTENGVLRIIDRRKNLVKTQNGEYIAIEKLESIYRSSPFVQDIMVYADESKVKPIAVVVPLERTVNSFCDENNIERHEDVAHEPEVVKAITKSLQDTGKEAGLKGIEIIAGVVISPTIWTPQNGYLSSAQKLQRKKILAENKAAIEKVYSDTY